MIIRFWWMMESSWMGLAAHETRCEHASTKLVGTPVTEPWRNDARALPTGR